MVTERRALVRRGIPFLLIGLFILLLFLYYFVGVTDIVMYIQQADPLYFSLAVVASVLSTVFASLTWQRLLSLLSIKAPLRKTLLFTWIGTFVDILIPAESISGEVSKVYLMSTSSNEDAGKVAASVVSQRILSMATTLSGLIVGSVIFVARFKPPPLLLGFIVVAVAGTAFSMGFLFYLCLRRQATERVVDWVLNVFAKITMGRWKLTALKLRAERVLMAFYDGIETLGRRPKGFASPIILSTAAWAFDLLVVWLVFASVDPTHLSLGVMLIVYSLGSAFQTIPIGIPGEVGLIEIVTATLYTLLGIPISIGASVALLTRVITLWFRLLMGGVAVQWAGIKTLTAPVGEERFHS